MEIFGGGAKREETEDTEGEAETIRRMLSLHHYFNTHSPSADSSPLFFYDSRSLSSLLCIIHPLFFKLISLVFISPLLPFSVVQILRQMSHEIFAIETRRGFACECVWVAGFRACTSARACVRFDFGFEGSPRRSGR